MLLLSPVLILRMNFDSCCDVVGPNTKFVLQNNPIVVSPLYIAYIFSSLKIQAYVNFVLKHLREINNLAFTKENNKHIPLSIIYH